MARMGKRAEDTGPHERRELDELREKLRHFRFLVAVSSAMACILAVGAAWCALSLGDNVASTESWGRRQTVLTGATALFTGAAVFVARLIAGLRP